MKGTLLLLLALPACAQADLLFVDYEGRVDYLLGNPPPGYAVGDRVSGRLIIDESLAPPDIDPQDPVHGRYMPVFTDNGPYPPFHDFVSGYLPNSEGATDSVGVENGLGRRDFWGIADSQYFNTQMLHDIIFSVSADGIVRDDGLHQSFELDAEHVRGGEFMVGALRWVAGELTSSVNFTLDHLSVRPGRCFNTQ